MRTLDIELIEEPRMEVLGRVQLSEIGQLSPSRPVKG